MKRWIGITAGVTALGLLAYLGGALLVHAQTGSTGGTRVATVNMYVIMKNYKKVETLKKELQSLEDPIIEKLKGLKKSAEDWVKYGSNPSIKPDDKDKAEKVLKDLKRQMEDEQSKGQKIISERAQSQIVQVYREIEDAIKKYSGANGISVVLHYMEPIGQEYTPMNIDRKINMCGNAGACFPVYMAPGVDISDRVVEVLNSSVPTTATPASTGG